MEEMSQKFLNLHKNCSPNEKFAIGRNKLMSLSVILPCYNEEENVKRIPAELIPVLKETGMDYEIIVVDDGCADNTASAAQSLNIPQLKIVRHQKNKGLGEAIKTGFANAGGDLTITLDTDFTFHPRLIIPLLERFKKNDVDLVIGSPELAGIYENVPFYRLIISKCANLIYRFLFNKPVTAISQILRVYKTEDIKDLKINATGFDVFAEILFKLVVVRQKRFAEIPAPLTVRIYGVSKLNYKKEIIKHAKLVLKIIWWKISKNKI